MGAIGEVSLYRNNHWVTVQSNGTLTLIQHGVKSALFFSQQNHQSTKKKVNNNYNSITTIKNFSNYDNIQPTLQ
jgi:hypothetical protein